MRAFLRLFVRWCVIALFAPAAFAGPVIIAGTDLDDHGSATSSANLEGWLFLQRSLESVAAQVKNNEKVVVCLGCNGQIAANAFASAFDKSSLPGAGWTRRSLNTAAELNSFFSAALVAGTQTIFNTGIVYMPSDRVNTLGGLTEAQVDIINANYSAIVAHARRGGGLVSLMQSGIAGGYGWLKSAIPSLTVETTGILPDFALVATTALGQQFPALSLQLLGAASHAHLYFKPPFSDLQSLGVGASQAGTGEIQDTPKADADPTIVVLLGGANVNFAGPPAENVPVDGLPLLAMLIGLIAIVAARQLTLRPRP